MRNFNKRIPVFSLKKHDRTRLQAVDRDETAAQGKSQTKTSSSFPLSSAQQRLWYIDQWIPGCFGYNIPVAVRLNGKLDGDALEQSLNEIIRRHETLRASFKVEKAQPVQVVTPEVHLAISRVNLQGLSKTEQNKRLQDLAIQKLYQAFDLAQSPLLRANLFQLDKDEHVLLLIMHCIIADSWSAKIFLHELAVFYQSITTQQTPLLPDLPIQYADFAVQQRQWLQTEKAAAQLAYWKQQLAGAPPVLQLPTDRPRPAVQSFQGAHYAFQFSRTLAENLKALSKQEGVTLFTTLLAAVNTLLFRYTRQDDIIVGTPISNRMRPEAEKLIGLFANTLVLRTNISGNSRFVEILKRTHGVILEAYAYQDFPFERLVEEMQPKGDLSYNSLFQVMVTIRDAPEEVLELPNLILLPMQIESQTTSFDITFAFSELPEGLGGHLTYNTDIFDTTTIARLIEHLQSLLEGIVAHPEQRIERLPLLKEAERQQLLVGWNDTSRAYPTDICVHQLFEAQALRTPEAIAATDEYQGKLTYRELNEQANRLARHLRTLGVGSEVLVGISLDRSIQMLIGLLAIFKAGGAYVPLDPDFPAERLAYMIEDAQIEILLTQDCLRTQLPIPENIQTVCIDRERELFTQQNSKNLDVPIDPEKLAYVLYTSGSTGKPKGVQIPHRALVNFLCSMLQEPGISASDTLLAVTTLSFDIAGLELYLPLLVGARVAIATRETVTNGLALARALEQERITVLQATPVTWRMLANSGWRGKSNLVALCGGEALPRELAKQLLPRVSALYNMYGPTETTIWSTLCHIQSTEAPISIGRPIANTQLYVLDVSLQPVPIGAAGELYIGGDGVARGYLQRPELTQERFLPNPFSTKSTALPARIYRTGDLVRYLPDGLLEHLGRLDHQVKIRGFRIELGEIETALSHHNAIQACVVVAQDDGQGNKRLVAYIVAEGSATPPINDLYCFLKAQLPDYMLPSAFVLLQEFPLTPNGKVDRKALPRPDTVEVIRDSAIATPHSPTEKRLVEIVAPLLGLEQAGIDDNFFLIGGNSFMGIQLIAQVGDIFGIDLPLRTLFNAPTVRQLAAEIERLILARLQTMSEEEARNLLEKASSLS